jgi:hypothetical protein
MHLETYEYSTCSVKLYKVCVDDLVYIWCFLSRPITNRCTIHRTLSHLSRSLPRPQLLRVDLGAPGQSDALPGGHVAWMRLKRGAGIRSVHIRSTTTRVCWLDWRDARSWLYARRKASGSLGQIRCWLPVLLLVAELLWMEPDAAGRDTIGYSINKALAGYQASVVGDVRRASLSCHGGGEKKSWGSALRPAAWWYRSWDTAISRGTTSAAMDCLPTMIAIRWLLQSVMKTGNSTSSWRPDEGLGAALHFFPGPSGSVPGVGEEGCRSSSLCFSGRGGSDCFSQFVLRVLFAKSTDRLDLLYLCEVRVVTCTCPVDI